MAYNFEQLKHAIVETESWLKKEFASLRTGRASPAILDIVTVESYGSRMQINQVAGISIEDVRTIRIVPWDMSQVKAIEKAIIDSNLGLSVSVDDKGVRAIFPELTSERRMSLVKVLKQKTEEAKITLRKERDRVKTDIEAKEKEGGMGEDEKFRHIADMQKLIDEGNAKLEASAEKKETEIMN